MNAKWSIEVATEVETSGTRKQEPEVKVGLQFLPDSSEQIAESIKRLGPLQDQLCEVFRAAIARAKESQQEPVQPAITETKGVDPVGEAPWKEAEH